MLGRFCSFKNWHVCVCVYLLIYIFICIYTHINLFFIFVMYLCVCMCKIGMYNNIKIHIKYLKFFYYHYLMKIDKKY